MNAIDWKFKKTGCQRQEGWTMVETEERSVGNTYVSTGSFASVQDSTPNRLHEMLRDHKRTF